MIIVKNVNVKVWREISTKNTSIDWYDKVGKLHRDDGPAEEFSSGNLHWYIHGKSVDRIVYINWLYANNEVDQTL